MNTKVARLVTVLISFFLLAYVGYQAYLAFYLPVRTQQADYTTVEDTVSVNGLVLHDESIITSGAKGILDFVKDDGSRVSKNGTVALVYSSAAQAEKERRVRMLDEKIKQLKVAGSSEENMAIDINVLESEINQKFTELAQKTRSAKVEGIETGEAELLGLLNKKQIATGKAANFSKTLQQLQSERDSLERQAMSDVVSVTTAKSGYFISRVDGYENVYNLNNILKISTSDLKKLFNLKTTVPQNAVGKVVSGYEWYISCILDTTQAAKLHVGSTVDIRFPFSDEEAMPASVVAKNDDGNGNFAVVFRCDYMTSKLAVLRLQNIEIVFSSYSGIKVSNEDLYMKNGVRGVYVLSGNTAKFKTIDPVYSGSGFIISRLDSTDSDKLQIYDQVIESGKNLYDNKLIK